MPPLKKASLDEAIKQLTTGLKDYRHVLLNGTAANWKSIRQIENRVKYMSDATDIFNKILEDIRDIVEGKADEN